MNRLQRLLNEVERERDSIDPQKFLEKYKVSSVHKQFLIDMNLERSRD
jgi:hypothetical protein